MFFSPDTAEPGFLVTALCTEIYILVSFCDKYHNPKQLRGESTVDWAAASVNNEDSSTTDVSTGYYDLAIP